MDSNPIVGFESMATAKGESIIAKTPKVAIFHFLSSFVSEALASGQIISPAEFLAT